MEGRQQAQVPPRTPQDFSAFITVPKVQEKMGGLRATLASHHPMPPYSVSYRPLCFC